MIKKLLESNNHPHIILRSLNLFMNEFNKKYQHNYTIIKRNNVLIDFNNHNCYIFDLYYDNDVIIDFINDIILNKNITRNNYYIVFKNLELSKKKLLNFLSSLVNKYGEYKIVIISKIINILPTKIKSKCLIFKSKIENYKSDFIIKTIDYIYNSIYLKHKFNYKKIIIDIKEISMLIISSDISLQDLMKNIIDYIYKKPYILNKQKKDIIDKFKDIDYKYTISYYKIIYYEYSLLYLYKSIINSILSYYI